MLKHDFMKRTSTQEQYQNYLLEEIVRIERERDSDEILVERNAKIKNLRSQVGELKGIRDNLINANKHKKELIDQHEKTNAHLQTRMCELSRESVKSYSSWELVKVIFARMIPFTLTITRRK